MLILRPIERRDLDDLVELAVRLDSVNLPSDRDFLAARIESSLRAFAGEAGASAGGLASGANGASVEGEAPVYVFVMEDEESGRCVGSSMILAKHGTPEAPYYWLEVSTEERRSVELDRRFLHQRLRLRSSDDGPTEIGGLILHPDYRRHPQRCGKALSIVRFAYMSLHPDRFEREVMAEMLSPFEANGENLLWEAFGRKFTGMDYREADHLSARTKGFIADLFPRDPVYTTLFPEKVQRVIGKPNDSAVAAVRILEKVGFHPLNQVDPFDGGPYYGAARDAITSVSQRRELVLPRLCSEHDEADEGEQALLTAEGAHGFRSTVVRLDEDGSPRVGAARRRALGVEAGDRVSITPIP